MSRNTALQKILKNALNYVGQNTRRADVYALSLLDKTRLLSLATAIETIKADKIKGDIVETGVWRGGSTALMKTILNELRMRRIIWCCDTYAGFPKGSKPHKTGGCAVPLETVKENIKDVVGSLDGLRFVVGDFRDTLPGKIGQIALLHFDGDSPMATKTVLDKLYNKVSKGGVIVIDDYCLPDCRKAITAWLKARFRFTAKDQRPILMNPYTGKELVDGEAPCGMWFRKC